MVVDVTATDNVGVTRVEVYGDGTLKCTFYNPPYSCDHVINSKPNTTHTVQAKAYDAAQNSSSQTVTVTVGKKSILGVIVDTVSSFFQSIFFGK